jgi:predicted Rossmann fold nucleotide-binding protein DprA/Smf involved in DNA uptake
MRDRAAMRTIIIESSSQTPGARRIVRGARDYPAIVLSRLGDKAPAALAVLGNPELLRPHRTALFCSARTPGEAILRAHDAARRMRDEGVTVISGFHSPIEKECLRILLRGKQPIIICPARAIGEMRIPTECREAFSAGRVMFLSPFGDRPKRVTKDSALRRNEVVAALADAAYIAYVAPGGQAEQIAAMLAKWRVPDMPASN